MAGVTNATSGKNDKGKAKAIERKERNQRRCICRSTIFFQYWLSTFKNDVECADFVQSTLNGHHYFLYDRWCTPSRLVAAEFPQQWSDCLLIDKRILSKWCRTCRPRLWCRMCRPNFLISSMEYIVSARTSPPHQTNVTCADCLENK